MAKGNSVTGASIKSEDLFLSGCRALAYSICSTAVVLSPLDAARQEGMKGVIGGGGSRGEREGNFSVNASRLRHLRQVGVALRTAAGQEGIGDSVSYIADQRAWCSLIDELNSHLSLSQKSSPWSRSRNQGGRVHG